MEELNPEWRFLMALAYPIWPVSLVFILTGLRKERFIRYHGYQSLYLGICSTVLYLVVGMFLKVIPLVGGALVTVAVWFWFIFVIYLAIRCWQGDYFKVPLIYELAQGIME